MRKINKLCILFGLILVLASPLLAQDEDMDVTVLDEDTVTGEWADEGVITGEVTSLDVHTGVITVKAEDSAEKTFSVVDGETILWKGIEDIGLADINKGEEAEVGYYTDENGKLIASWVDVLVEEETAPAETMEEDLEE